jgi:hypothetical protein
MPSPRDDGRFEVPVGRLPGGSGGSRRAGAAAAILAVSVGGAFLAARIAERDSAAPATAPEGSAVVARASGAATPGPSASPRRSAGPRIEALPAIGRVPLPGAPEVTLLERAGDGGADLRVVVWTPDDARTRTIRQIPRVVERGDPGPVFPLLAPNRRHVLLFGSSTATTGPDTAAVLDDEGHTLWTGAGVTATSGGLWSADSRLVVVPGQPRVWHLITLSRPGHAMDRAVTLPFDVYVPYPVPRGWLTFSSIEPRTVPLGFSADGAWIYGGVISPELGMLVGQFRVAVDGSAVEPVADFRVGRPDGLVPRQGTSSSESVDPATGRVVSSRINSDTTGGPRTLEVRGPDESFQFALADGVTLGAAWGTDGDLYTLGADAFLYPESLELRRTDAAGTTGPALFTTGPLTTGALVGVRDGFAVVALLAGRPQAQIEFVVVDLAHPERVTALPLDATVSLVGATLDR